MGRASSWAARIAALLVAGCAVAAEASDTPLCRVEVHAPERGWVGEQLRWELHVTRRRDVDEVVWDTPLAFPGFRAEWLPGGRGEATAAADEGYERTTERRALFPAHEGTLSIPDAALLCRAGDQEERVAVRGTPVIAMMPPREARPEGWDGIVGPVRLQLNVTPDRIAVGGSVRVSIMLRGPGNLWHVDELLDEASMGSGIDVFPGRPELARDTGEVLTWRRYLTYDLVPRTPGTLTVPALELVSFDPASARYLRVATEPRAIEVAAAALPAGGAAAVASEQTKPPAGVAGRSAARSAVEDGSGPGGWVWASALLLLAGAGAWLFRRRLAPDARQPENASPIDAVRASLDEAERAEQAGDASAALGALARGLRGAVGEALPGAEARSTEELLREAEDLSTRGLVELLVRVERLRYEAGAAPAEVRALMAELAALLPKSRPTPRDPIVAEPDGPGR